jgi:hypothetical protein
MHEARTVSRGDGNVKQWSLSDDLIADLRRQWDRGAILAEMVGAPSIFPYRFRLTRPKPADLLERYEDVRVVTTAQGTRSVGRNQVPSEVWVDSLEDAALLLHETIALPAFRDVVDETTARLPALLEWLSAHCIEALAVAPDWPRILDVVLWLQANPRPDIYVRQVNILGVHTKFIEQNRKLLSSILDTLLPVDAIDSEHSPSVAFDRRYGFRVSPSMVRIRSLDPSLIVLPGADDRVVSLTVQDFSNLIGVHRVFVTENYVNFLAFPPVAGAIVVFGEGYDVGKIAKAPWIASVPFRYWGDIDTHGFAILDHLRSLLPHVTSLLMDHATLHAHEAQWGFEHEQVRRDLNNLTRSERALYDDLRDNRIRANLRLEQELTPYALIQEAVSGSFPS